jgi:hypothetical protein
MTNLNLQVGDNYQELHLALATNLSYFNLRVGSFWLKPLRGLVHQFPQPKGWS